MLAGIMNHGISEMRVDMGHGILRTGAIGITTMIIVEIMIGMITGACMEILVIVAAAIIPPGKIIGMTGVMNIAENDMAMIVDRTRTGIGGIGPKMRYHPGLAMKMQSVDVEWMKSKANIVGKGQKGTPVQMTGSKKM
jgi:hypothetical protein